MAIADRDTQDTVAVGPRTRVRAFSRADVDTWQAWPDYAEQLLVGTSPRRMAPDQRSRWFEDITLRQRQIPFAIVDESGEMIGRIFLRHVRHEEGSAVLGIDLHPGFLGRGYGTESLGAFLHHFFGALGFQRMLLSVAAHNVRARRCYESLGFLTVGSHWDAHVGPDLTRDPQFAFVRQLFRRGPLGLESMFYDMRLERTEWQKRIDTAAST
ncbi:MAG TPA: GNAT family N-acetyltransferase [Chloroflexota bacterium]|nr:GNAT family N-acetyltransferase [Chloroflexota bacterium]